MTCKQQFILTLGVHAHVMSLKCCFAIGNKRALFTIENSFGVKFLMVVQSVLIQKSLATDIT